MIGTAVQTITRKVGFYGRRLRQEKLTKIVMASVASLALVLQLTVGLLPFTSTPVGAVGDDNIIRGGISSKENLLAMYDSGSDNGGHNDITQIYSYFGVSRQDIANATVGSYKTNDFQGTLKTLGRTNWPNIGRTAVSIPGTSTTIYTGPYLDNANSQAFVMPALIGKRSVDGQWFAITLNCGNIVYSVPPPKPTPPTPPPVPAPVVISRCDSTKATQISRTEFSFLTQYTAQNTTYKSTEYVITNDAGQVIARTTNTQYTQSTPGTYTVQAYVTFTDNGKDTVVTSSDCVAHFTVAAVVTPTVTPVATPMCDIVGKENLPKNSPACVAPVVTQPVQELPKTGLSDEVLKFTGVGSIIAAVGYYAASRRNLLSAILSR